MARHGVRTACIFVGLLALCFSLLIVSPFKANAETRYDNSLIADKALEFVGKWGGDACRQAGKLQSGQCKQFVNCIVYLASGHRQYPIDPGDDYQREYSEAGGREITMDEAFRGDIIQLGTTEADAATGRLHTAIIVLNRGHGLFQVIDSNYQYDEIVRLHDYRPPNGARFWRLGNDDGGDAATASWEGGPIPNGMIVADIKNEWYVAAGGSLFWFDRNDPAVREPLLRERRRLFGEIPVQRVDASTVESLGYDPNRDHHHIPRDNTFLQSVGSNEQYVILYQAAFHVGSAEEVDALHGRDTVTLVPPGVIGWLQRDPGGSLNGSPGGSHSTIPNDTLLTAPGNPTIYHMVNGEAFRADNQTVVDCVLNVKHGHVQVVVEDLLRVLAANGHLLHTVTHCSFPHDVALGGHGGVERWRITGDNPYERQRYNDPLALRCWLGSSPSDMLISTSGINSPVEGAPLTCPNGSLVRVNETGRAFQVMNGELRVVPDEVTLACLSQGQPANVIAVNESMVAQLSHNGMAHCSFENKLLEAPDGRIVWIKSGKQHWVMNDQIVHCLAVRGMAGDPIRVGQTTMNGYREGKPAYCPYGSSIRFVKGAGQSQVWRVYPDGTRQWVNGFCITDPFTTNQARFRVAIVPAGEVDGHSLRNPEIFNANWRTCERIP